MACGTLSQLYRHPTSSIMTEHVSVHRIPIFASRSCPESFFLRESFTKTFHSLDVIVNDSSLKYSFSGMAPSKLSVGHKGDGVQEHRKKSGSGRSKDRENSSTNWRNLHKDWRTWAAVVMMLIAMGAYVLTLDDSVQPTGVSGDQGGASSAPSKP